MGSSARARDHQRPVYLVDGARTPFLKARGRPGPFSSADLAVNAGRTLLMRQPFEPGALDQVVLGCVSPGPDEANIARVTALRMGCDIHTPAWTAQRNCGSGMQALDAARLSIAAGHAGLVLAGGTESMSHIPLMWSEAMTRWLGRWTLARGLTDRLGALAALRPAHLKPIFALMRGLTDPVTGLSMGQTAEILASDFQIDRGIMDGFAVESHRRAGAAEDNDRCEELEPMFGTDGKVYAADDGVRRDSDTARLAKLEPVFDRPHGKVTAGNSAQVTDGAAWALLAGAEMVDRYGLTPLARLVDTEWAGLEPERMGLGPVYAVTPLLRRHGLRLDDVDYWEINEAFAAQVLACLGAWTDADWCNERLGPDAPFGELAPDRLNVDGGAIALGHPVGATGTRIVLHLAHILRRHDARRGVATLCIGGGQGGAMLLER